MVRRTKSKDAGEGKPITRTMEESNWDDNSATVHRPYAIVRLLVEQQLADKSLQKIDHVLILDSVGMSSSEIGIILGQPSKDIAQLDKETESRKILS